MPGIATSQADVTGITRNGLWLYADEREYFLAFANYPWFQTARVSSVLHLERPSPDHLYWPELDVDLHLESLEHPERFPLISQIPSSTPPRA